MTASYNVDVAGDLAARDKGYFGDWIFNAKQRGGANAARPFAPPRSRSAHGRLTTSAAHGSVYLWLCCSTESADPLSRRLFWNMSHVHCVPLTIV